MAAQSSFRYSSSGVYSRSWSNSVSSAESPDQRPNILWIFLEDTAPLLGAYGTTVIDTPRIDELVPGFGQTEPSSSEFLFSPNRRIFAHAKYAHDNGAMDLDWNVDLAWQRIDDDRVTRDFEATGRRREANRSDLLGLVVSGSRVTDSGSWILGAEAYLDEVSSSRSEESLVDGQVTVLTPRFPDGSDISRFALFGNGERQVTERQLLSGGVRISREDVSLPRTAVSEAASVSVTDASAALALYNSVRTPVSMNCSTRFRLQ